MSRDPAAAYPPSTSLPQQQTKAYRTKPHKKRKLGWQLPPQKNMDSTEADVRNAQPSRLHGTLDRTCPRLCYGHA